MLLVQTCVLSEAKRRLHLAVGVSAVGECIPYLVLDSSDTSDSQQVYQYNSP